jgi:hypothetical protein
MEIEVEVEIEKEIGNASETRATKRLRERDNQSMTGMRQQS